jgi:queuosine biosynthesis protein QueD
MGKEIYLYIDGASKGNPGPAAIGVLILNGEGKRLKEIAKFIGKATNNVAEYQALISGLKEAIKIGATEVIIHTDSELLVKQIQGEYRVRSSPVKRLFNEATSLLKKFPSYEIRKVEREENLEADGLANQALLEREEAFSYQLGIKSNFDAAHFLRNYQGKCARLHGHTWEIEVIFEGKNLRKNGILLDFGEAKALLEKVIEKIDHQYLNEIPPFDKLSPTAENLARFIYGELESISPFEEAFLREVRVWESPSSWVSYKKPGEVLKHLEG